MTREKFSDPEDEAAEYTTWTSPGPNIVSDVHNL